MKTAKEAEARHTLQYLLLRQKIPPITKNALGTISNSIVGTADTGMKEKVSTNLIRRGIRRLSFNIPNPINIIPAAFLILNTYPFPGKNKT
ncbi:MAG: hypothetical protein JSW22_07830 [Chloroflexota bacterium]|nr:MAG: hypothetical protein JSW22_07830 [Chloroflexota bacterium]